MPRLFEVLSLGFQTNEPFLNAWYPEHWTPKGRKEGAIRFAEIRNTDPYTVFLKAVDEDTGAIVGMAKWNIYDGSMPDFDNPPDPGNHWSSDEDKQYALHLGAMFVEDRIAAIKKSGGHLVSLDLLAVVPQFQRKGVGDVLVKWGTKKADELDVEAVVEASVFGKGLYVKNGFVFLKDVELRVPEKWEGLPKQRIAWLIRPRKSAIGTAA